MTCQEQRYVKLGRWGEWRPCDKAAKHEVVAAEGGKGFERGDTIHVCGVHKRKHEQRARTDAEHAARMARAKDAEAAADERAARLGAGRPHFRPYQGARSPGGYTGGLVLTGDEVDALLAELGR